MTRQHGNQLANRFSAQFLSEKDENKHDKIQFSPSDILKLFGHSRRKKSVLKNFKMKIET